MDPDFYDNADEAAIIVQALRSYARATASLDRFNRVPEPARPDIPPRVIIPARQPVPSRRD
jgi:hypothetical protein